MGQYDWIEIIGLATLAGSMAALFIVLFML